MMLRPAQALRLQAIGRQIVDAAFVEGLLIPRGVHGSDGEMALRVLVLDEASLAARQAQADMGLVGDDALDVIVDTIFVAAQARLERLTRSLIEIREARR